MKKVNITLAFDDEKLDALEFSLRKENTSVQAKMDEALRQLYEKTVPEPVREYLDSKTVPAPKAKRPPKPPKPQAAEQKNSSSAIAPPMVAAKRVVTEMANDVEITLWLDRRWKAAIEKQLKDETLQEHLEEVIDKLCNQLPEREYARISNEIQNEARAEREATEAIRTWSAYRVVENGEEWYFKTTPGEELLNTAKKLRGYLKSDSSDGKFVRLFLHGAKISPAEYQDMMRLRMENTGKVTGVFDIDFDKREFSAVHIMEGWKSWAMQDVSAAAYRAFRKGYISTEERYSILLDQLDGREITTAGHLSARNFTFGDEIIENDGKLNFYIETWFDVDKVFGTYVLTEQNNDWLNVYANYDMERGEICDTLELTLCKGDGSEEAFSYHLNAAEREVLLRRMEDFCHQQTGMSLNDYAQQLREEQTQTPEMEM